MAFKLADRVAETAVATGLGNITLQGAQLTYRAFSSALDTSDTTTYCLISSTDWEIGIGTLTNSTTLSRDTILASSQTTDPDTPVKVSFSGAAGTCFIVAAGDNIITKDASTGAITNATVFRQAIGYASITAMKAVASLGDGDVFIALGASAAADGGGGVFVWDADDATSPDNVNTFRNDNFGTGLFKRATFDVHNNVPIYGVYTTLTALRAVDAAALVDANQPAIVIGAAALGDIEPFVVYWSASSSASDDGVSVFRPSTGAASTGNGRWLRAAATRTRTMTSADATPSVANIQALITAGTTNITDFDDGAEGQVLIVLRGASDITIEHDLAKIVTASGEDLELSAESRSAQFFHSGGVWYQVGGSGAGGGAVGGLSAADYDTIELAVAAAYAAGERLYLPAGTYAASGNVANLHDVDYYGPGAITRSGETYYATPGESTVNDLYVNPATGDDANDGITAALPLQTLQRAIDIMATYDRATNGRWEIELAAGTYAPASFPDQFKSNYRVEVLGPALSQSAGNVVVVRMPAATGTIAAGNTWTASPSGATGTVAAYADKRAELTMSTGTVTTSDTITFSGGGSGAVETLSIVPTAVIQAASASDTCLGMAGEGVRVVVRRVKVQGATAGNGFENTEGRVTLIDCHAEACLTAVVGIHLSNTTINGGDFDGRNGGSVISGSVGYKGLYNATHAVEGSSLTNAPCFHHFARGILLDEGAVGHLDYTMLHDCTDCGVEFTRQAEQSNTASMQIYRNAVGVRANNSPWFDNSIDFGHGTTNANTVPVEAFGLGVEYDFASDNDAKAPLVYEVMNSATNTTDDTYDLLTSPTFPKWAAQLNRGIKFEGEFTCTLTGNLVLTVQLVNVTTSTTYNMASITIPSAATYFDLEVRIGWPSATNNTRSTIKANASTGAYLQATDNQASVELAGAEWYVKVSANKNAAGDTLAGYLYEMNGTVT